MTVDCQRLMDFGKVCRLRRGNSRRNFSVEQSAARKGVFGSLQHLEPSASRLGVTNSAAPKFPQLIHPSCELMPYHGRMAELVFEVVQESDGGYCAECLTESIFTEGDTWDELRKNVLEATSAFFFDRPRPERVRLHLVRDEVLLVA